MTASATSVVGQRRRNTTAAATLIAGAVLLWATFHTAKGSTAFWIVGYLLAAVWVVGALATEPVAWSDREITSVGAGVAAGVGAFVAFYVAYRVLREIPVLAGALRGVVGTADAAHIVPVVILAIVNALAEETFFRGALFSLVESRRRDPLIWSTAIYAVVTAASFNVALIIAALVLGALLACLRRWSGGVVAPAVAHVVWSSAMLLALHR